MHIGIDFRDSFTLTSKPFLRLRLSSKSATLIVTGPTYGSVATSSSSGIYMRFISALTTESNQDMAVASLMADIGEGMGNSRVDLIAAFFSPHFAEVIPMIAERLREAFHPQVLIGCTAEGVIGSEHEIEQQPAISLLAGNLPGVKLDAFSLHNLTWQSTHRDVQTFAETLASADEMRLAILLADPFSTPVDALLDAFNTYRAGVPVIGGIASGATQAGGNTLLLNDHTHHNGAVGVAISGAVSVDVIVSQGCRPIGKPLNVTAVKENVILGLEGEPPLSCIQDVVDGLSDEDRELLQNGIFVGRAINPRQDMLGRGDFLIRAVMGVDPQSGAIVVGDEIEEGEMIQFHIRDAETAEEDLDMMLAPQGFYDPPCGGFLFSCNGRGTRLYDHPNGDIRTIRQSLGLIDLAGFFCAGEIGPIRGRNFLHGHTASMVLFRDGS